MSCQILQNLVFLLGIILLRIIIPPVSIFTMVDGAFVIINHSGRELQAQCGDFRWIISVGERAVVTAAMDDGLELLGPLDFLKTETKLHQPSNGWLDMLGPLTNFKYDTKLHQPSNGGLEMLGPLAFFKSETKLHQPSKMCRIEAGDCFLSWDPAKLNHHNSISEGNPNGDYVWEVDKTGVSLMLQASNLRSSLDRGAEYEVLWQPTSELLSGATKRTCAPPSSPLAQAFYSVLLYFRE